MISKAFFPLRSSADWFSSEATRAVLERRLKNHAILYDELIVQDGRYLVKHSLTGSFDRYTPAGSIKADRSVVSYFSPNDPFVVQVASGPDGPYHPIFRGPITASYEVDFFPLLKTAGVAESSFITWLDGDLNQQGKSIAQLAAKTDLDDDHIRSVLPGDRFVQSRLLNGLYIDSILADQVGVPFTVDAHAALAAERKSSQLIREGKLNPTCAFQNVWMSLMLPDFSDATWDEIVSARESGAGKDLRQMVARVVKTAGEALPYLNSEEDLLAVVRQQFNQELVEELRRRRSRPIGATLNMLLNLIPSGLGGVISVPNDLRKLVSERRSWVTFLDGLPRGIRIGQ